MSLPKLSRRWHRIGAIATALPVIVIFTTGFLLQLKKDWTWVQPPTERGSSTELALSWDAILAAVSAVPEAEITSWGDVDRLDVRPGRGMLKVRANNRWEVQLDARTGEVLSSTYRRSDLIESIHDGSWFHDKVKLFLWLPTAVVLVGMWLTGVYLWWLPHGMKRRRKNGRSVSRPSA
jgi:uncharacterized iron-regulated membrane protein